MGIGLVWKRRGPGSQQVLGEIKRSEKIPGPGRTGIGHTGTLDPFAEGLLLVGTNEGTKLLALFQGLPKTYQARMLFGVSSDTLDDTGTLAWSSPSNRPSTGLSNFDFQRFIESKMGDFSQIPPQYSAAQVDGQRAYDLARKGIEVPLKPRNCSLTGARSLGTGSLSFQNHDLQYWDFEVTVSSGTYIRALARDWGQEICGFPGLLCQLKRIGIGPFQSESSFESVRWLELPVFQDAQLLDSLVVPPEVAIPLKKNGLWRVGARPQASIQNELILSESGEVLAAWNPVSGKLGRVFQSDPFSH